MEEIEYDLKEYDKQYERIRKDNEELLAVFREDLSNLTPTTIRRHLSNVDFYINEYLLYEEPLSFDHGKIVSEDYNFLCDEIKNNMPDWQALCEQYNDPESENPFFPF